MSSLDPQAGPVVKSGDLTAVRNEDIGQWQYWMHKGNVQDKKSSCEGIFIDNHNYKIVQGKIDYNLLS